MSALEMDPMDVDVGSKLKESTLLWIGESYISLGSYASESSSTAFISLQHGEFKSNEDKSENSLSEQPIEISPKDIESESLEYSELNK